MKFLEEWMMMRTVGIWSNHSMFRKMKNPVEAIIV